MNETYSIREMAEILKLNESTVRYFRDMHKEFFPYVGQGRRKRYKSEALEALRLIADSSNRSLPHKEIKKLLYIEFTNYVEVEEPNAVTVAGQKQTVEIMELLTKSLDRVADQTERIEQMEKKIEELEKKLEAPERKNLLQRLLGK